MILIPTISVAMLIIAPLRIIQTRKIMISIHLATGVITVLMPVMLNNLMPTVTALVMSVIRVLAAAAVGNPCVNRVAPMTRMGMGYWMKLTTVQRFAMLNSLMPTVTALVMSAIRVPAAAVVGPCVNNSVKACGFIYGLY